MYAKVRAWSRNWFTHIFLFLVVLSYSLIGTSLLGRGGGHSRVSSAVPQAYVRTVPGSHECRFLPNPSRFVIHQSRYVPQPLAASSGPFKAQHVAAPPPPPPQFPEPCAADTRPSSAAEHTAPSVPARLYGALPDRAYVPVRFEPITCSWSAASRPADGCTELNRYSGLLPWS
jgi:hypothetical protein